MIFGMLNPEIICLSNLIDFSTSPVRCSHFTLRNPKKVIFNSIIHTHTSDYWRYLRRKQTVIHLPTQPGYVTTLTCELQNFFLSDWRFFALLEKLEALTTASYGLSSVALKRTGCNGMVWYDKCRFICVATGMSCKQCHSKCPEWPPSALIHASSLFQHCSVT